MLDQETKKRIDDCRNILVGKVPDPKSQVEQITIAMIYKFMYDMDLESIEMGGVSTFFTGDYEKYSWGNIFNPRIGGNEMIALYGEGIVKMNLNPNIPQLFRDIFKNAYLPYRDPETLKLFLKGINEFHYSHSEKLGDAFEYLLSIMNSQGDAGQFRTPRHIIDFVVELIQPKKNEKILDPACGTSGFLISSYKHILRNNTKKNIGDLITSDERNKLVENFSGYDISPDMVRLSLVNLYLHNFSNPKIYEYDTLTSEDRWNEYYDVILANPPFMSPKGGIKPHKRFSIQSNRAEVLFVDYIMEHLTPKGRSGIVVPEGIIFQSGSSYKSLRKSLVEKYLVGVISLPSGIFQPYSGVKTSILILDKELSQKTDKIFFGKVDNDGFDLGSQRREIDKNDLPILKKEVTEYLEGLRNGKIIESEKLTYVSKEQILTSNDIGFSYDRYSVKESINSLFPIVDVESVYEVLPIPKKIKSSEFLLNGKYPIIDQSDSFISGFWNNEEDIIRIDSPVIIFGDHSRVFKFIDFNFVAGADGIKILKPNKNIIDPKYLYFILKNIGVKNLGYSRHYKELKNKQIPLPPLEVQEEIVRELEKYQKIIDGARQVIDNYKPTIDINPIWEMKELESLINFVSGVTLSIPDCEDENGIKIISMADITEDGEIVTHKIRKVKIKKGNYSLLQKGDLLFNWRNGSTHLVGKTGIFELEGDYVFASFCIGIRVKEKLLTKYLWYLLNQYRRDGVYFTFMRKSINGLFNREELKILVVPIPSIEEQKLIIEKLDYEMNLVSKSKDIIEIFNNKIQNKINKIWGS
jgi:type I restriction enzyme M protein